MSSYIAQSRPKSTWPALLGISLFILLVGAIGGFAVATGAKLLIVPVFGLILGLFVLLLPVEWLLLTLVALTFLVVGVVGYFAKINQIYWVPYILGLVIWFRTLVEFVVRGKQPQGAWPFVLWAFVLFLIVLGINAVVIPQSVGVYLVAAKNYVFLLSVFLAGFVLIKQPRTYELIWKFLLLVALLQLPMAIYQYVVVGGRIAEEGGGAWDAVSGTFGGSESGGASGFMGIYLVTMLVLLITLLRNGQISGRWAGILAAVCLSPVFIGEVKAIFLVFLPVAFFWLFRKEIARNPLQASVWSLVFVAVMAAGLFGYQKLHYQDARGAGNRTAIDLVGEAVLLDTDPYYVRERTGEMGRVALLVLWWQHHGLDTPRRTFFGHGLGSMRVSSFYIGEVQKMFPRQRLDKHALSVLLWDTGVIGAFVYILLLVAGSRLSLRLSSSPEISPLHRAYLEAAGIYLILALVSLVYSRSVVDHPAMILLVMLSLGQAMFWHHRLRAQNLKTS
jgi:hypothetical protein